ncbi:MAG: hypothetical protein M3Q58_16680 [Bacteroidota bacterium]|nr:hypothetical protein [Bacteroidota bacterium]
MLDVFDILLPPFYLLIIYIIAYFIYKKNRETNISYKYFIAGLTAKIIGAVFLTLIYVFYYNEAGDTINYYSTSVAFTNVLLKKDLLAFFELWLNLGDTYYTINYFDHTTGFPGFASSDKYAFYVARLLTPICLLSFKSFIIMSIVTASISYIGIWKLYQVFYKEFPHLYKELAVAILFIPSVVFWGSGLLKDTIAFTSVGLFVYGFYHFFVLKKYKTQYLLYLLTGTYLIVSIKPYILFAMLPGCIIWLTNEKLQSVGSKAMKYITGPFLLLLAISLSFVVLSQMSGVLGQYALDNVMDKAVVTQNDMKQDYYGGNTFDIGEFDSSVGGVVSKAPLAIIATLFRPYIWEARNPVMILSGLENTYLLLLTLYLLIKLRFFGFFTLSLKHPLLLFSVLFSLFFAFSIGISISNFGSLVRLKIPSLPFFVASLFILKDLHKRSISTDKPAI